MNYETYSFHLALEILNSKTERFDEIKKTITDVTFKPGQKIHSEIQQALKSKGWKTEERVSKEELVKGWQYDAYKDRIAVEIDTGSPCYRSYLKLILGYNKNKIDVGVIIVYHMPNMKGPYKRFKVTIKELKDLFTIIPVPIFLIGIYP